MTRGLIASRNANRTGAPRAMLNIARWLATNERWDLDIVLGRDGPLRSEMEAISDQLWILPRPRLLEVAQALGPRSISAMARFGEDGVRAARLQRLRGPYEFVYVNTIGFPEVSLSRQFRSVPMLLHVHEMASSFDERSAPQLRRADRIIVASHATQTAVEVLGVDPSKIRVIHESIDPADVDRETARRVLRDRIGVASDARVVGGVGTIGHRKGTDLFVEVAAMVARADVHFLWLGGQRDDHGRAAMAAAIRTAGLESRVTLIPEVPDAPRWISGFDVLALPSREDPFPLVVLEAAAAGVPTVCFADAGGIPELGEEAVAVVPFLDVDAFAARVANLLADDALRESVGSRARSVVLERHTTTAAGPMVRNVLHELVS